MYEVFVAGDHERPTVGRMVATNSSEIEKSASAPPATIGTISQEIGFRLDEMTGSESGRQAILGLNEFKRIFLSCEAIA